MNSVPCFIESHDLDELHMKGLQNRETIKCEPKQSQLQTMMYGVNYSLHPFSPFILNSESHDMEKIHVIGRLELHENQKLRMNSINPNYRNCFFQHLNHIVGKTFFSKIIFCFFNLKKNLKGESLQTNPSSLNLPQLGVDYYE